MSQKQQRRRHRPPNVSDDFDVDDDDDRRQRSQLSQVKRRRQAAVSIAAFSSKRGHDRAILEYKKRKDEKFQKNAVLLREYQRAMKAEGYDAGRGASRKRVATRSGDGEEEDIEDGEGMKKRTSSDAEEGEGGGRKKRRKADPLYRARKEAKWRKDEQAEMAFDKEQRQKTENRKQQDRKMRSRKLMKRTRRGQPVMKNVIGDMLEKIKSEVKDGGER